jgi:unsaturated rhamnogalacturonyl hydrolase
MRGKAQKFAYASPAGPSYGLAYPEIRRQRETISYCGTLLCFPADTRERYLLTQNLHMKPMPKRNCRFRRKSTQASCAIAGALLLMSARAAGAQTGFAQALSARIADASLGQPAGSAPAILLNGIDAEWYNTADGRYFRYLAKAADGHTGEEEMGAKSREPAGGGRGGTILLLYRVTQKEAYYQSATALYKQPAKAVSAEEAYNTEPFLAQYAAVFHRNGDFGRIAERMGQSPQSPGARNLGFRLMMVVDALQYFPQRSVARTQVLAELTRMAAAAGRTQTGGLWSDAQGGKTGETGPDLAASAMLTYGLARGVRMGWLTRGYEENAARAWKEIASRGEELSAEVAANDRVTAGALLLAANEMELAQEGASGRGSKVLIDGWYNSEKRSDAAGQMTLFHYKWNDYSNPGFSLFGHIFESYGAATGTLEERPTAIRLRGARFYFIVSPDNRTKVPDPHYMTRADAAQIALWVKRGGVLVMMENDPANADIQHMDLLADRFGLHFNDVLVHHVIGNNIAMGRIDERKPGPLFRRRYLLYMKDTCSLKLEGGAVPLLRWKGDILMATAHYGKGTAVAVTDPWLYNEYTDGRKLPAEYDNFAAGRDFVRWLLQQK